MGHVEKDYSSLINPRNKDLNTGITSASRNVETKDKEEVESEDILDSILKTDVFGRARYFIVVMAGFLIIFISYIDR